MKKRLAGFVFSAVVALSLAGCSSEASKIDSEIAKLGDITLDSYAALEEVNQRYESLEDEEKGEVQNYSTLEEANKKMNELLYEELAKALEEAASLEVSYFAGYYDMNAFSAAKEAAQEAVDASDAGNYHEVLESLEAEIAAFDSFIEEKQADSYSLQTNDGDYPFAVDSSKVPMGITLHPYVKHSSEYPKYVSFWPAETTDTLPEFTVWVGDKTGHYSCEFADVDTKGIEVQDVDGTLKTAYVNTELVLHETQMYTPVNNGIFPLGEGSCYLFENGEHGLTIAVEDVVSGNGYLLFKCGY